MHQFSQLFIIVSIVFMDKVLFFHPRNDFTGSTRVLANIIESDYNKQSITVITVNKNEGLLSGLSNVKIIGIYYPQYHGKNIPIITPILWRLHVIFLTLFYGYRFDVFYINTIIPYYAAIIGRIYRKKIIYHIHEKFIQKGIIIMISEYIFNHCPAKRIYVSEYVKNQYKNNKHCETIVKYNTLPVSFLSKVKVVPIELRTRKVIIMMCSLTKIKGIFTFISLAESMPEFKFKLIISADYKKIKDFLFDTQIPVNLEIVSAQKDIHPYLQSSDVILNLSIPKYCIETFGMTILEAMAYGIPAIVPNVGGPLELVSDGYNGFCIDVTNIEEIRKKIMLILDENNYKTFVSNSLIVLKKFIA